MENAPEARQSEPIDPQPTQPAPEPEPPAEPDAEPTTPHLDAEGNDAGEAYVMRDGVRVRQ